MHDKGCPITPPCNSTQFPSLKLFLFLFFEGGRSSQENWEQKLEGKMEGRKEGRKEGHPDRWDKQMDSRDGQMDRLDGSMGGTGWTEKMRRERMNFFSFSFFCLIFLSTLHLDSDQN
jgi:hypothetical protein